MNLVFDIETCGVNPEELSESQQEFIYRYAEKETNEEQRLLLRDEAVRYLSLYPLTAKVVAVSMLNVNSGNVMTLFEGDEEHGWQNDEKKNIYKGMDETSILAHFWEYVSKAGSVITFNGRCFDIPFLMIRSAMLRVKPSRNFLAKRYDNPEHIDLLDKLTYNGTTKKFNLDFYCRAFGVESPKSKGVTGMDVKDLYNAGRIKDIAIYCADDVRATYELYKIWKEYMNV